MIIVVIDGPDGVGKTTVATKVVNLLQRKKLKCIYQHFPFYSYPSGELIKRCLNGENGSFINMNWRVSLALYDIDRFLWIQRNKNSLEKYVVITDRWSSSSFQYQTAQIVMQECPQIVKNLMNTYGYINKELLKESVPISRYLEWLDTEHGKYGLQKSTINFYLSLDQSLIYERINQRFENENSSPDQFESDDTFTYLVNAIGDYLSDNSYNKDNEDGYDSLYDNTEFVKIDANETPDLIARKIVDYISNNLVITLDMIDC